MAVVEINGARIYHETFGDRGPWLALNAGGRHRGQEMAPLARAIAERGFRTLVHDRRNTGASDIIIAGNDSEEDIWADDLVALLGHYGATRAFFGGSSAGARLSMTVLRRHHDFVQGLLLMRVTGGVFAAGRLPNSYYGQFIKAAHAGGMQAVCDTALYRERLALNPASRERLMAMDPRDYMATMGRWLANFTSGPVAPVMGVSNDELRGFDVPTLVVPGNDRTHSSVSGLQAAQLIPNAELFELPVQDQDLDLIPFPDWKEHYPALVERFVAFMEKHRA